MTVKEQSGRTSCLQWKAGPWLHGQLHPGLLLDCSSNNLTTIQIAVHQAELSDVTVQRKGQGPSPGHASAAGAEAAGTPGVHQVVAGMAGGGAHAAAALALVQVAGVAVVPGRGQHLCLDT